MNLNTALISVFRDGQPATNGLSLASLATKWRFFDEDAFGVAVSTYPRADVHHPLSSSDPNINSPGSRYFVPLELSKTFGQFGINPEVGIAFYSQGSTEWNYGIAMSFTFAPNREALFEIHGRSRPSSGDNEFLYNLGTRYALADWLSLIGTVGKTFISYSGSPISWNFYLGLQIRL